MTSILGSTGSLLRIGMLAAVVIAAAISLGGETKPVSASHTEVFFSYSNTEPIPAPVIVIPPGKSQSLYIWVTGIDDPTGISGFQVEVTHNPSLIGVFAFQATGEEWLGSTGRNEACSPPPQIFSTYVTLSCNTIGAASPPGPTSDALLATIGLNGASEPGPSSLLNLSGQASTNGTYLLSTPLDLNVKFLQPLTLRNSIVFLKCGDVSGPGGIQDGTIDLFNDIVGVINRFGWNTSHPEWDSAFDMDVNGTIDLFNDIVAVIQQYGTNCWQA